MINILGLAFPTSIWTFVVGVIIGLGITITTLGALGFSLFIGLVYCGVIRITPFLKFIHLLLQTFQPTYEKTTREKIERLFEIKGISSNPPERGIYCFHPHNSFSVSYFFHTLTHLTKNPVKGKSTVANAWYWFPWGSEILEGMNGVPNRYLEMKKVLENKENLFVIPGGISEMNLSTNTKDIKILLKKKRGIFRLALETGTPLIPVITYGEEELYELAKIPGRRFLEKFGIGLPIPSLKTIWKLAANSIETPVKTIIGSEIPVKKVEVVTEVEINQLRKKYIEGLQELFDKTKPPGYTLEVV